MDATNVCAYRVATHLAELVARASRGGDKPPRLLFDCAAAIEALADDCVDTDMPGYPSLRWRQLRAGNAGDYEAEFVDGGTVDRIVDLLRRGARGDRIALDALDDASALLVGLAADHVRRHTPVTACVFDDWPALRELSPVGLFDEPW